MSEKTLLLWEDIETSGLDTSKDHILEVAFVLTDTEFNELGDFERVILPRGGPDRPHLVREIYSAADPIVQAMHTTNGLWKDVEMNGAPLDSVAWDAAAWCKSLCDEHGAERPILAGASLHALDWPMLQRDFKELSSLLHHRAFDVSTMKRAFEWWNPAATQEPEPLPDMAAHRAMPDCRFTMCEAQLHRTFFRR